MNIKESSRIADWLGRAVMRARERGLFRKRWLAVMLVFLVVLYVFFVKAPAEFPEEEIITIEKGMTLSEVSYFLEEQEVIRSSFLFKGLVVLTGGGSGVVSGEYYLDEREGVFSLTRRLTSGAYHLTPEKVTLPEGTTVDEMAEILAMKLPHFDRDEFKERANGEEGYLFPDTYFFLPNAKAPEVYRTIRETFDERIVELEEEINAFGKPLKDVITMASLLEEEARTTETRRIIAGILWKRIAIGMPLQVDAVFPYIIGKNTFEVTLEDLEVDSPYNTYKYRGLPPAPITNPGLDSIRAAVTPRESPYLFYLSDRDGNIYYARNFEVHKRNKAQYLD